MTEGEIESNLSVSANSPQLDSLGGRGEGASSGLNGIYTIPPEFRIEESKKCSRQCW
jgi:hypothetical protein